MPCTRTRKPETPPMLQGKGTPAELRLRIKKNIEYRLRTNKVLDEGSILALLPSSLRSEVALCNLQCMLDNLPFFGGLDEGTKAAVAACVPGRGRQQWQPPARKRTADVFSFLARTGSSSARCTSRVTSLLRRDNTRTSSTSSGRGRFRCVSCQGRAGEGGATSVPC